MNTCCTPHSRRHARKPPEPGRFRSFCTTAAACSSPGTTPAPRPCLRRMCSTPWPRSANSLSAPIRPRTQGSSGTARPAFSRPSRTWPCSRSNTAAACAARSALKTPRTKISAHSPSRCSQPSSRPWQPSWAWAKNSAKKSGTNCSGSRSATPSPHTFRARLPKRFSNPRTAWTPAASCAASR